MKSFAWVTWKSIGILKNFTVGGNDVRSATMNSEDEVRLQYLCNYICTSLKVKPEKWLKLLMTDDYRVSNLPWPRDFLPYRPVPFKINLMELSKMADQEFRNRNRNKRFEKRFRQKKSQRNKIPLNDLRLVYIVMEWLNNSNKRILIISTQTSGFLVPSLGFPIYFKGKSCYFVKKHLIDLSTENMLTNVLCGDVSSNTIGCLSTLVDQVIYPLLNNTLNRDLWPQVIVKDIENQMQSLQNTIAEVKGRLTNKTILAVPIDIEEVLLVAENVLKGDWTINQVIKNKLEGMVIKWCHQIDDVLNNKPIDMGLFPVPSIEYNYWSLRHSNLENINSQVSAQGINTILMILKTIDSVYYTSFHAIFQRTKSSLEEARDIRVHLNALAPLTEQFETIDFNKVKPLIKPLIHCTCLTWANSIYYCTKDHWTRYFSMVCNLLIRESTKYLDSSSIFQGDIDESLSRMEDTIDILEYFNVEVLAAKSELHKFKKPGTNPIEWSFQAKVIFKRLNGFIQRLRDIRNIFQTAHEFSKLDRIEIGGVKGRNLSRRIGDASLNYQKLYSKWGFIDFDPLDSDGTIVEFEKIRSDYQENSDAIERSLAQIFIEAFNDCYTTEHCIQLIEMVGSLFDTKIIKNEIQEKYKIIGEFYHQEVIKIEEIFNKFCNDFKKNGFKAVDRGASDVTGTLKWIYKLKMRLITPIQDIQYLDYPLFRNEDGLGVMECKTQLEHRLLQFEISVFEQWKLSAAEIIPRCMAKNLIKRSTDNLLILNFENELIAALKEIKLLKSDCWNYSVPDVAAELFQLDEALWQSRTMLSRIVEWYNFLKKDTEKCEFDIIASQIVKIDADLEDAIKESNWSNYKPGYLKYIYENIQKLHKRITTVQGNVKKILRSISEWGSIPMYQRKDYNKKLFLDILQAEKQADIQNEKIKVTKELIQRGVQENFHLLFDLSRGIEKNEASHQTEKCSHNVMKRRLDLMTTIGKSAENLVNKLEAKKPIQTTQSLLNIVKGRIVCDSIQRQLFEPYERYVDQLISQTLMNSINVSICYIKSEMINDSEELSPLLGVQLELCEKYIRFLPPLKFDDNKGLLKIMENIFDNIFRIADAIPRVFQPIQPPELQITFKGDLMRNDEITEIRENLLSMVKQTIIEIEDYVHIFDEYDYIWLNDKKLHLEKLISFGGNYFDIQENDLFSDIEHRQYKEQSINLFNEEIDKWESIYSEIDGIESFQIFNRWLRLDILRFKHALLNECCKWGNEFKQHLVHFIVHNLNFLQSFIESGMETLQLNISMEHNFSLLSIMAILNDIKDRSVDYVFETLQDIINVLRNFNVDLDDSIGIQFAELPDQWYQLTKMSYLVQEKIAPIKVNQVNTISKQISVFDHKINKFRENFKQAGFFQATFDDPYELCSTMHQKMVFLEVELRKLNNSATLFKLSPPTSTKLETSRREIRLVKQIWDFVYVVESSVNDWKKTAWKRLDVEEMEQVCKKFTKDVRSLGKSVRQWQPFLHVEELLKNLLTSLRAITELQNTAIRDRHWNELMLLTGLFSKFGKEYLLNIRTNKSTTLRELLSLNLHMFEEDVKITVDKAVKEMAMEKTLNDIANVWNNMEFEYETHQRSDLQLLKVSEELIETLEENQVQVQNISTSKYIGYFEAEFIDWRMKLGNADQIVNIWSDVQRKWTYLESIFTQSEDIRKQLPDDSERFDRIDKDFRTILLDLTQSKNVMVVTNQSGLFERIEVTLSGLILCEKALNDYLETKRLAYPRFYFISSTDLLDILSHGTEPKIVGRHLTKLYDSIMKLIYRDETKAAVGMCSKENEEYVEFCAECLCTGNVEIWLNRVTDTMRATLHKLFAVAVVEYEDKTRESWIFEWPAQVSLCITQIWWSIEVNEALKKQQEGYENAMKDYQKKQISQLNALITLLLGELTPGDRQKIMTICTIDVHSRECVAKMISQRVENSSAFQWQSQLRHRWDYELNDCFANICDAQFKYDYEYLGNTPRLVITPLTDRCYVTLTQSLHLIMGGAPAGPAGTGKTETTKDLGKGLGIMVYVFNCSEQMDYRSCGNIYKGLAQTGAWGCFDEFNRISIEVLSVVAVQVKCIQDSLKTKKSKFMFMGELITLKFTVGLFITMNPGYAGRTELPENLKALFRPCAMVVPDFALICEIMLVAEGFQEARVLAKKFITLYTLCKELLSQQDHYDWGLRAIKSVLVVAGSLRRGDRQRPEDQVLMRALRDFNIPKINSDDLPIFLGLIGDLFPALDVPRRRCFEFEKLIKKSAAELRFQPEDGFLLKVVQLDEILAVRHSVFIVGNAGTGKTAIWKTLYRTYCNQKLKPHYNDLNPKGVTNDELFGIINQATREWKDGLFSVIMRDQANIPGSGPKWIVLDGDIDPMWIESLNTVMDDNKVLTLASNERIALTNEMRLLFEIADLKSATPATVSRAGILYINTDDLGWYPFVSSWIETRENIAERSTLTFLFDKYLPIVMETSKSFKRVTPTSDIAMIQMTCHLLECLLVPKSLPTDISKELYEMYFVFAIIWGFGSTLYQDQLIDWRNEFNRFWHQEFKNVRFPYDGNIFNYFIHPKTSTFRPWSDLVSEFVLDEELPLQSTLVPTPETVRLRWFLDILIDKKLPVMLIGGAGCGKSVIFGEKFSSLSENYALTNIPLNFYTSSEMLQRVGRRSFVVCATTNTSLKKILEKPLEKKAGRNYAPAGNNFMIFHVDDLNMPEVDRFGTVEAHQIIRQFMDYNHWYDRTKLTLKDIHNCQFLACMNPTAGSFTIDPRLQRHFCSFAVGNPCEDSMYTIYHTILTQHLTLEHNRFTTQHLKISSPLVTMGLALHSRISLAFLPTAVKFHYIFNLRDLANIYQGILYSNKDTCPEPEDLCRLYVHEAYRVYGDKMVCDSDSDNFRKIFRETFKKTIEEMDDHKIFKEPLIFCHFSDGLGDPKYMAVKKWSVISSVLAEAQQGYNEIVGHLNLVMFEDAIAHVCRINRILEGPRGNALLIGVGGSGKQSLARLAAYISCLNVYQIQIRRGYGIGDLRTDISTLFMKVGVKNIQSMFLITDAQVTDETFLVLINDLLASGEIPDLFADEEVDTIINAVRNEVKQSGMLDTKDNCWKHFVDKVRRMLKIVLCFSPVGEKLRKRARKFPALTNCTQIDWFHEWPKSALESVSKQFLSELDVLPSEIVESVSSFMSYVFPTVNETSQAYLSNERRFNYTTPKSFLELISLYSNLLNKKTSETYQKIERLENGLVKLAICADQVDSLKHVLAEQEIQLSAKNEAADKLIVVVSSENEIVQKEKRIAAAEEKKIRIIEEDVSIKAKLCEEDLHKAEPMLIAAQEALNTLNKNNITELKSFGTPPQAVINVCAAVLVLFSSKGKLPRDRSWKACKQMMGAVDKFLHQLIRFDKEHIPSKVISALKPYLDDREFDPQKILAKSSAASGLCAWVINIYKFYNVYLIVGPKQRALKDAQLELKAAQEKMDFFNNKILAIEEKLSSIKAEFDSAMSEKTRYQDEADKTSFTIDLAHRLVNGLGSEAIRWHQSVDRLKNQVTKLPGDVLLIACFVSYVGCFTRPYRTYLLEKLWKPTFRDLKPEIPHTEGVDPLDLICDDAQVAAWNNEGLPSDRMSTENAIILMNSVRWPLMIDPQLQGLKWIKQKFGQKLIIIQLTQKKYLDIIEKAIPAGDVVLLENIGESVDAVLDTLLSRTLIKKGKAIKIGDKEVDFSPSFKLILQTKLANPHYKPEMQAQTTLINFTVTRDGLEDQLLAEVVKAERPDLEKSKCDLTIQQNSFKISLKSLEDDLLARLSSAGENVLDDPSLVLNLEKTKKTAAEIENKVAESKITSLKLDNAREHYRAAAERSSILYFILNDLVKINKMYQFSLKAFITVFKKAIDNTPPMSNVKDRVKALVKNITHAVFMYTCRGLFERDKLVFMTQMIIQILVQKEEVSAKELDFLLRFPPHIPAVLSPFDFLSNKLWGGLKMLSMIEGYRGIDKDLEQSTKRWKAFVESETPERLKLPGEWKNRAPFQKLCIIRSLRPDRMIYAAFVCVEEIMGQQFVQSRMIQFSESFKETSSMIPVFFILSPGVDPLTDVEKLGKKLNYSSDHNNFHNVSLGQGQERVAENAINIASQQGHWVILQNIHLVAKWLPKLEKKIEQIGEDSHEDFRLFISAEPAPSDEHHIIPQGILESAIKITNEPPTGMKANLHKALDNFNQETIEMCSKEAEFKSILFALCYFHSVVAERRKFGPQGWNIIYPFNVGDLTISVYVLFNYLEGNKNVPWEDLRYLFGEIMYGGHITDDWDRRLCRTYLEEFMQPELVDGDLFFCKGFEAPPNLDYMGYHQYINNNLPSESPNLYGMHPNSEIGFLTSLSNALLNTISDLQPRAGGSKDGGMTHEDSVKQMIEEFQDKLPDEFNMNEVLARVEERTPFVVVALQECERMNLLITEIRRSLRELLLGLKGELSITADMEIMDSCLLYDKVPDNWTKLAYPSLLGLQSWMGNLILRQKELEGWILDFTLPPCVWLAGFFNPQSFLTAIMQTTARKNEWPLDKMCLSVEVTGKMIEDFINPPKEGAYIHGLYMEGARWDIGNNCIATSRLKELCPLMPVVYIKAITQDKQETKNIYECPVYRTRTRAATYIWTFNLKSREKSSKWILGGVAILLQN